ncbi:fibronectin type III domain-containing protein [Nonomuraea sp. KM90]|uniref:fibronectin type III domain-containing protein n=1 Tax=Nonomuraea sp. KM90 TaxID=3457428 RepID=UPI003FCE4A79
MRVLRGDRITAVIAGAVAAILVAAAAWFGVGVSSANPKLADVGAWLWTKARGKIVHVNGLSGEVDGYLDDKAGRRLRVVQDGGNVLLVDDGTGYVSRIEPSQLSVAQTRDFGAAGLQLAVSGAAAYAVDPAAGRIQQIDPLTLDSVGSPVTLPGPLGAARIDSGGRLWVPVTAKGEVVPVAGGVAESPVRVGEPGEELSVTIAGDLPVVVNTRAATATIIGADGGIGEITLPKGVAQAAKGGVLTPAATEGALVPILTSGDSGLLVVIDTGSNSVLSTKFAVDDPAQLGVPQVLGSKVYVPHQGRGSLIVWDSAAGGQPTTLQVTQRPGPVDVFVKDGLLWANDENGDKAVVIDPEGRKHDVAKDDSDVPGPTNNPKPKTPRPEPTKTETRPDPVPEPDPVKTTERPRPTPTREPTREATPSPTPTSTPTPSASAPSAPGAVSARSGPGRVTVTFTPSAGGKVERYTLKPSGEGRSVPQSVDANGPFQFEFTGGDCANEYTFVVVAHWRGGEVESEPSPGAKPCVAPGSPTGFAAKAKNRGAELSWTAPEGADDATTYELTGAATNNAIKGTTFTVDGLKNNQKHTFKLKARNAAGESPDVATTEVDLAYPRQQYKNASNEDTNTLIRPGPSPSGEAGRIPQKVYITLTVICQVKGASYTDTSTGRSSDIWNRIESQYGNGYLNDTLVATPDGGFPEGPLFECTD